MPEQPPLEWFRDEDAAAPRPMDRRRTARNADEEKARREVARRHTGRLLHPMPETGPCCGRCRHWHEPAEPAQDPYGECGQLHMVAGGADKGQVLGPPPEGKPYIHTDPLRCGPAFQCTRFQARVDVQEAA